MADDGAVWDCVSRAIDELNEGLPVGSRVKKQPETTLFGVDGQLTSLQTLNLIFLTEQNLRQHVQPDISLAESLIGQGDAELPATLQEFVQLISGRLRQ